MIETERMLAWQEPDHPEAWNFKPLQMTGLWEHILGDEWWWLHEEQHHLQSLFHCICVDLTEKADDPYSVYEVTIEVEYAVESCPYELGFLGYSQGTNGWNLYRIDDRESGPIISAGYVRRITLTPLMERTQNAKA